MCGERLHTTRHREHRRQERVRTVTLQLPRREKRIKAFGCVDKNNGALQMETASLRGVFSAIASTENAYISTNVEEQIV